MFKKMQLNFILFFLFINILNVPVALAQASEDYDPNTEITLTGVIVEVSEGMKGLRIFTLQSGGRVYHVKTGPRWYLWKIGLSLKKGMNLEVTGSKLYDREGMVHLIVYSLKDLETQKTYQFRKDDLIPIWRGMGKGMRGHS